MLYYTELENSDFEAMNGRVTQEAYERLFLEQVGDMPGGHTWESLSDEDKAWFEQRHKECLEESQEYEENEARRSLLTPSQRAEEDLTHLEGALWEHENGDVPETAVQRFREFYPKRKAYFEAVIRGEAEEGWQGYQCWLGEPEEDALAAFQRFAEEQD